MTKQTAKDSAYQSPQKGTGFLFWGLVAVTVLNLVMILGALSLFAL